MIPGRRVDRWFEKKAVIEALATVPPVLAAAIGALASLADPHTQVMGWWLAAGAVWLVGASGAKVLHARAEDRQRRRVEDYEGLRSALHMLFAAVCHTAGFEEADRASGRLRVTMHRVVPNGENPPEELEQLLPYVGGPGEPPGRRFSTRTGIIGRAARLNAPIVAARESANYRQFVQELVWEWAFPEHEARKLSSDRHAWMAVPIDGATQGPMAIVYLDSNVHDFFSDAVQSIVLAMCDALKRYITEAYP
jgi:hypothetical protein